MVNDFVMVYVITDGSNFVFDGCGFAQAGNCLLYTSDAADE